MKNNTKPFGGIKHCKKIVSFYLMWFLICKIFNCVSWTFCMFQHSYWITKRTSIQSSFFFGFYSFSGSFSMQKYWLWFLDNH